MMHWFHPKFQPVQQSKSGLMTGTNKRDGMLMKYNHDMEWRNQFDEFCDTFVDDKFERFYHGLTGKSPRLRVVMINCALYALP